MFDGSGPEWRRGAKLRAVVARRGLLLVLAWLPGGACPTQAGQQSVALTGTLVDERGAPVANAEVLLRPVASHYRQLLHLLGAEEALPAPVDRARSGPDGEYRVEAPELGPYRLEVVLPGPRGEAVVAAPLSHPVVSLGAPQLVAPIELPDGYPVAIRVLDGSGQPIAGARVIASPTAGRSPRFVTAGERSGPLERVHPRFHRTSAGSASDGVVRFLLPTADASVVALLPGFDVGLGRTGAGRAVVRLKRGAGVRIRALDLRGRPVPGVVVRVPGPAGAPLAATDESGEATVGKVGQAQLELEGGNQESALVSVPVTDRPGAEQIVEVRLRPPLSVLGRVVDARSGDAIEGAAIWDMMRVGEVVYSSSGGTFDLHLRPSGERTPLVVNAPGYVSKVVYLLASPGSVASELAIPLAPAAPLFGQVTDGAGRPISDAVILAAPRLGGERVDGEILLPRRAVSVADGGFVIPSVSYAVPYRLTVNAVDYSERAVDVPPLFQRDPVDPLHVVLTRGREAFGRVVDTEGGAVAGAEVRLVLPMAVDEPGSRFAPSDRGPSATTNEGGVFRFPVTAPGSYEVYAAHADHISPGATKIELPEGEGGFDLGAVTLVRGKQLHGVVTTSQGQPIPGATVRTAFLGRGRRSERTATTGADGGFLLAGLPRARIDLTALAEGFAPSVVAVEPGSEESVTIALVPGASISGRVVDSDGNAAPGAWVTLVPSMDSLSDVRTLLAVPNKFGRTDAEGSFRFADMAMGSWALEAELGAAKARLDAIQLAPGVDRRVELELRLQDQLAVTVTTHRGVPVVGAEVRVESFGDDARGYGRTDLAGRAVLHVVPGSAVLTVDHAEHRSASRPIELGRGGNEVTVELEAGGEIHGVVRSSDGVPLAGASVHGYAQSSVGPPSPSRRYLGPAATVASDRSGEFRLKGLDPASYVVVASAPDHATDGPDQSIQIVDDSIVDDVDIVLDTGAKLVGVVSGLSPADLAQIEISASRGIQRRVTRVDAEGRFVLERLAPGRWDVLAAKGSPPHGRSVETKITIAAGDAQALVELRFEPGFRLSGQVLTAGRPETGAMVFAEHEETGRRQGAETDLVGRFEIEALEAGTHRLTVLLVEDGSEQRQTVELQADLEDLRINFEPRTTSSGVVIDAETGQPLANAWLSAGTAEASGGSALSGAGGRFVLRSVPSGGTLRVSRRGYETIEIPIAITPGDRHGLVIELTRAATEPAGN